MRSVLLHLVVAVATVVSAQDTKFPHKDQQIPAPECLTMKGLWEGGSQPCSQDEHEAWLAGITHWRNESRIRIGYDGARYDFPPLKWTQSSFIQPQMMVHDRYFYDPASGKYTVDRYLDDLQKRYGGIDAVIALIQHLLQKFDPEGCVRFEWSNDCSKPRPDAYGGGAAVVTAKKVETISTGQWLASVKA